MTNLASSWARSRSTLGQCMRCPSVEAGVLTSRMATARGSRRSVGTWPDVSTTTSHPASRRRATNGNAAGWDRGSPPVTQARRAGCRDISAKTSSSSRREPSWNAYAVSQYVHRRGQPVRRRKTQGRPTRVPSPWREKKISFTVSKLLGVHRAAARRFPHAHAAHVPPLRAQALADLLEEVAGHHF